MRLGRDKALDHFTNETFLYSLLWGNMVVYQLCRTLLYLVFTNKTSQLFTAWYNVVLGPSIFQNCFPHLRFFFLLSQTHFHLLVLVYTGTAERDKASCYRCIWSGVSESTVCITLCASVCTSTFLIPKSMANRKIKDTAAYKTDKPNGKRETLYSTGAAPYLVGMDRSNQAGMFEN